MNIIHGDCLEELKKLEDNSVDAVVTDPPYGLSNTKPQQVADVLKAWVTGDTVSVPAKKGGFMGKDWDSFVPPPAVWEECMRVLKPGGHMAVFAGARTQDLMGLSIRLAGFEIRDTLGWVYGSGMPKSLDVSKAIDKRPGVHHHREFAAHLKEKREAAGLSRQDVSERVVGTRSGACWNWEHHQFPKYEWWPALRDLLGLDEARWGQIVAEADREVVGAGFRIDRKDGAVPYGSGTETGHYDITAPATSEAQRWDGWGTALKPAIEPIILARKPLDGTVANNVLAHGVGGLNIDACRVGTGGGGTRCNNRDATGKCLGHKGGSAWDTFHGDESSGGRFPANVLLDEHAAKEMDKQSGVRDDRGGVGNKAKDEQDFPSSYSLKGVPKIAYNGSGGASRYFPVFKYQAKAPKKERPVIEREDGSKIQHPTVKPVALMEWLVELITPPGGTVLDPFAGSGTTLQAALNKGFQPIGIEQDADYIKLIEKRLEATCTTHKN